MRMNDKITHHVYVQVQDGYGGFTLDLEKSEVINACVSISNNDLKPRSTGMGFYRVITVILDSGIELNVGDVCSYNGVDYKLTHSVYTKSTVYKTFKGYEL